MTTPSSDIGVTMLAGATLDAAIASVQTGPASASLWEDLRASGYSPQLSYAAGAKVAQHSTAPGAATPISLFRSPAPRVRRPVSSGTT